MPVLGPLVAYILTPRTSSGRLIESTLEQLVRNAVKAGADAVAVLGSVGGAAYMPRAMRKKAIAIAVAATEGKVPVIAGVGALTTAEVGVNLAEAATSGAQGALLQPMSYQPLLPHEVMYLYEQANHVTPIPIWVYNNPKTTRHSFTLEELARLAQLENIAGFKDRAANAAELEHRIKVISADLDPHKAESLNWGFAGENKGALVLGAGAHTWHSALAGIMPGVCAELAAAAIEGRNDPDVAELAQQMQRALNPLTVIMTQYGGIRVAHAVASHQGLHVGELPQPLRPLPAPALGLVELALHSVEKSLLSIHQKLQQGGVSALRAGGTKPQLPALANGETVISRDLGTRVGNSSQEPLEQRAPAIERSLETRASKRHFAQPAVPPPPGGDEQVVKQTAKSEAIEEKERATITRTPVRERALVAGNPQRDATSREVLDPAGTTSGTAPQRVSAKALLKSDVTRADLAKAAQNMLLSGDPDKDATRVNIPRVETPAVAQTPESARDSHNYVPRRARTKG